MSGMFIITDKDSQAVRDVDACEKLQLIKRIFNISTNLSTFLGKYQDSFSKIGTLSTTHPITVDHSIPLVNHSS